MPVTSDMEMSVMKNKIAELKAQLNRDAPRERSASSSGEKEPQGFTFVRQHALSSGHDILFYYVNAVAAEEDTQRSHLCHQEQAGREIEKETARAGTDQCTCTMHCIHVRLGYSLYT